MPLLFKAPAISGVDTTMYGADDEEKRRREAEALSKPTAAPTPRYDVGVEEKKAKSDLYGDKPVTVTPTVQKFLDLNARYNDIQRGIDGIADQEKADATKVRSGQGVSLIDAAKPPPEFWQKKRDDGVAQLYNAEKEMHGVASTMTPEDFGSFKALQEYEARVIEANRQEQELYKKAVAQRPKKAAAIEATFGAMAQFGNTASFGLAKKIAREYENATQGITPIQRQILDEARSQRSFETTAGKAASILGGIAGFGLAYANTAKVLAQVPGLAPVIADSPILNAEGQMIGTLARTTTQRLAGGALTGLTHGAVTQGIEGKYSGKQLLGEAAGAAFFEAYINPAMGKLWRRMTTDRVGEATFVFRPGEGSAPAGAPQLPSGSPTGGASWIPKDVSEVFLNLKNDVQGIGRRMVFQLKDGSITEMRIAPQGDGSFAVSLTKDAPNWLKQGAMDMIAKFHGEGAKAKPISADIVTNPEPDMPALLKKYGSEEAIPLNELSPQGVADANAMKTLVGRGATPEQAAKTLNALKPLMEKAKLYDTFDDFYKAANSQSFTVPIDALTMPDGIDKTLFMKKFSTYPAPKYEGEPILVTMNGGDLQIDDGVHRLASALRRGESMMQAKFEFDRPSLKFLFDLSQSMGHVGADMVIPPINPVVADIPPRPIPTTDSPFNLVGFLNVKNFLGGTFYKQYSPMLDPKKFINAKEAVGIVRQYFTEKEVPVEILDRIITPEGTRALGKYREGIISFIENPHETTPTHEAVHAYLDLFAGKDVRDKILQDVIDNGGAKNRIDAEEMIADGFVEYARSGVAQGFTRKVIEFFKDMWAKITSFFKEPNKVDQLYRDIILKRRATVPAEVTPEFADTFGTTKYQTDGIIRVGEPLTTNIDDARTTELVARERFNLPALKRISGGGSDRDVFDLGNGFVLKIAKGARGLSQNDLAHDWYLQSTGMVPQTVETGKNYVVMQKVNPPDAATKQFVKGLQKWNVMDWDKKPGDMQQYLNDNGFGDAMNYDILWNDFTSIRNWGTSADGKPIHLDEGTFGGKSMLDQYEKTVPHPSGFGTVKRKLKNLENPEFRQVYEQSRAAKKQYGDTDAATMYQKLPDDPELRPYKKELEDATKSLEEIVTGMEKQIADATPENEQANALVGLAKEIRSVFSRIPKLPGGMTREQFFSSLAGSGDSVSAINDKLLKVADQMTNYDTAQKIRSLVNSRLGGGNYDDIEDWSPFQDAITSKQERTRKLDLFERADEVIRVIGDFEVEPGKTMSDVLDEIDMLEFRLNEKLAERAAAARGRKPTGKTEKQAPLALGEGVAPAKKRTPSGGRETTVSGRDLLKAISGLSKAKEAKFKMQLRQAVSEAHAAQKAKLSEEFAAKKDEIAAIKNDLVNEIRKMVPPERRGKFLAAVKNTRTRGQLEKALERVDKEVAAVERKEAIDRLKDLSKTKLNDLRPEYREPIAELINSVDPTKRTAKTMASAMSLHDFLAKEPDNQIPESRLKDLALLAKKPVEELTTEEISDLADSIAHLVHLNTIKNKLLIRGKLREYGKLQKQAVDNVLTRHELKNGAITGLDSTQIEKEPGALGKVFTVDSYNAELKAEILDGMEDGVIRQTVYDGIDEGVTEELRLQHQAEDFFKDKLQGIDMSRWSYAFQPKAKNVDKVSVTISGNRTISMSKGERIAFILHSMNPQNRKHLVEGGFSFPNTPSKIVSLTDEDLLAIEKSATDDEMKVVDAINEYLNTIQKDALNRVSVQLNGHEVAREKDYFPIRTSYLDRYHDDLIKGKNYSAKTLEGMGIFKARQNASNALIVEDAFTTLYKSIKQSSAYVGLAEPLRNAKMLLNDNEFAIAARTAGKNHYITSLKHYLERIEGDSVNIENVDKLTYDLINKLDVAVLGLNPFVMMKQPISIVNAASEMEWKYLAAAARKIPTLEDLAEMRRYSPQLRDRMEGHVTREAGEIVEVGAAKKFFTGENLWSQKFTAGLERFDRMAIGRIWNASKIEVKERFPELQGAEYWNAVTTRAEMIVRRTQSTSHVKDRSTIGMTKNVLVRMLTRFSSERNKAYQIMRRAAERYNRSEKTLHDKAKLANTLFVVAVVSPLIAIGIDAARDKLYGKDKKRTVMSTALDVVGNALGTVYFLGSAYDSLRSKVENGTFAGYDVDTSATQFMNQTIDTLAEAGIGIEQAISGERYKSGSNKGKPKWETTAKKFFVDAATTVAQLKGIPTAPIKMTEAAGKWMFPEKKTPAKKDSAREEDRASSITRSGTKREGAKR